MSLGGNGSAWAVVGGVIVLGLCAGLGTAGFMVSALDFSAFEDVDLFDRPSAEAYDTEAATPAVIQEAKPVAEGAPWTLPEGARPDVRLRYLDSALNQGTMESREMLNFQLSAICESGLSWTCSSPQHLGELDRDQLERSCESEEALSCLALGWLLTQRDERAMPAAGRADMHWMGVGTDLVDTTRDVKGADAFEQACALGEPRGCGELGRAYGWGVGRAFEPGDAQTLFELACNAGDARSCVWLGDAHEVQGEIDKAKALYMKACEAGTGEGCRARSAYEEEPSVLLMKGCDELADGRACIWQAQAQAQAGDAEGVLRLEGYCALPNLTLPFACDLAAGFYLNPENPVPQDEGHAVSLNRAGCAGGDAASCTHLGFRFQDGRGVVADPEQAKLFLEMACAQNHAEGCRELAEMHFGVEEGATSPMRSSEALAAMKKGCELEDGESCNRLGIVFSKGEGGVAKDTTQVEGLYRQACELGFAWGCFNEAWWSDAGGSGEAPWAAKKLKLSCEMGLAKGCDAYADRLLTGRGVAYDPSAGNDYKVQACTLGETEACI